MNRRSLQVMCLSGETFLWLIKIEVPQINFIYEYMAVKSIIKTKRLYIAFKVFYKVFRYDE